MDNKTLRDECETGDQAWIETLKAFRDSAAVAAPSDLERVTQKMEILENRRQSPAGLFLFLHAADTFEGAHLANGDPLQLAAWQSTCFIDL